MIRTTVVCVFETALYGFMLGIKGALLACEILKVVHCNADICWSELLDESFT